jgi:subtilisin family serine protease
VVAVLDSGVRTDHADLAAHYAWGLDTFDHDADPADANGHGTHCAGIAAAVTDNGTGIAGAGFDCRFAAYRCGDGSFSSSALVEAIDDAVARGAQVLSMSWGSTYSSFAIRAALQDAADAGCVLVAAAGNDDSTTPFYPAALSEVLAVGATAPDDTRSSFSNHGSWVDVAAPGQSIYSTWKSGGYTWLSGTSMATPLVAGQAALLYAALGGTRSVAAAARVRAAIEDGTADVGTWLTHGRVDFPASLAALADDAGPQATSLEPAAVPALGEDPVLLRGSGLLGVDGVAVDGVPASFEVLDDGTLAFDLPLLADLGSHTVTVGEGGSTSAPLALEVEATWPPHLQMPADVAVGDELAWIFGGRPGELWLLVVAGTTDTFSVLGFPVLMDFEVLALGPFSGAGVTRLETLVPPTVAGLTFHAQVLSGPGWFAGASNVATTTIAP